MVFLIPDYDYETMTVPNAIEDKYDDDYDITKLHHLVIAKLKQEKKNMPTLLQEKETLEKDLLDESINLVEKKKLGRKLEELAERIENVQNEVDLEIYLTEATPLLERYRQLGPIQKIVSFGYTPDNDNVTLIGEEKGMRHQLIDSYIALASRYLNLNITHVSQDNFLCPLCQEEMNYNDPADQSVERCLSCGYERNSTKILEKNEEKKTNSRYDDLLNFTRALDCYLGEQSLPPQSVIQSLEKWSRSYNNPTKEEILKLPLNRDGTRGPYGKEMLIYALSETKNTQYYKDVRLIGHLLWGWELLKLSLDEKETIIRDYNNTQTILENIPWKRNKSSMNTQIRLYRHLQARGYDVDPSFFKIPTTTETIDEADACWREMVKAIPGADFISLK